MRRVWYKLKFWNAHFWLIVLKNERKKIKMKKKGWEKESCVVLWSWISPRQTFHTSVPRRCDQSLQRSSLYLIRCIEFVAWQSSSLFSHRWNADYTSNGLCCAGETKGRDGSVRGRIKSAKSAKDANRRAESQRQWHVSYRFKWFTHPRRDITACKSILWRVE